MTAKGYIILFLLAMVINSCKRHDDITVFKLDGLSFLTLINTSIDSVQIQITNWYMLPWKSQEIDTIIAPNSALTFEIVMQGYNYYDLNIGYEKFKIFSYPGSIDTIRIPNSKNISYSGDLKEINEFLVYKGKQFNSVDAEWMSRIYATSGASFKKLININDSITEAHVQFTNNTEYNLPEWYKNFETKRLRYLNAGWKLNSVIYRKHMLNLVDTIPDDFLESTLGTLPVADEKLVGNMKYMLFLADYFHHIAYPQLKENPDYKEEYNEAINRKIGLINSGLTGLVKDAFLTFYLTDLIRHNRNKFDENWPSIVKDEELRMSIEKELNSSPILPTGSKLPYFYLPDTTNVFYQPANFTGKILLVNFWATWCKPCIKEFPHENALVEEFKGEHVEVLNICMESESGKWKEMIKKYGLKTASLLAEENWNKKLREDFDITGLPHSVLVDWKGNVVQNNCPAASENINEHISKLLKKMKSEAKERNR